MGCSRVSPSVAPRSPQAGLLLTVTERPTQLVSATVMPHAARYVIMPCACSLLMELHATCYSTPPSPHVTPSLLARVLLGSLQQLHDTTLLPPPSHLIPMPQ